MARTSAKYIHKRPVLFLGALLLLHVDSADIFVVTSSFSMGYILGLSDGG
jgi:hypothetical protein